MNRKSPSRPDNGEVRPGTPLLRRIAKQAAIMLLAEQAKQSSPPIALKPQKR